MGGYCNTISECHHQIFISTRCLWLYKLHADLRRIRNGKKEELGTHGRIPDERYCGSDTYGSEENTNFRKMKAKDKLIAGWRWQGKDRKSGEK